MARLLHRRIAALAVIAAVLPLSACGTPRVASASPTAASTASAIPPTPSANGYTSAIMFTKVAGAADLTVDVRTSVDGVDRALRGTGASAVGPGWADLTWTSGIGSTRELVNDQGIFVQTDPPNGMWARLGPDRSTPTSSFAAPIRELAGLADVVVEGREDVDGVATTRYAGRLPADPRELAALGLSEEEVTAIGDSWQGASIDVTVWIDDTKRVLRVDRQAEFGDEAAVPVSVQVSSRMTDYGTSVALKSPPDESVLEAPEGQ